MATVLQANCKETNNTNNKNKHDLKNIPKDQLTLTENEENNIVKCTNWLEKCDIAECDYAESFVSDSNESVLTDFTSDSALDSGVVINDGVSINNRVECNTVTNGPIDLQAVFNRERSNFNKIQIYKSKKVHIGDVTYINGPVYINQSSNILNVINIENQNNGNDVFPMIARRNWLAQPPANPYMYLSEPAKFVIIAHTATEEAFTQAENTLLVRLTQTFHIESRKFDDIAYNFLVSADGNVFEGRGWSAVGATAASYNRFSLSIAFVGCYTNHLPPPFALRKAKALIAYGIKTGAISQDYSLVGHCQCTSSESPGKKLYEEIQTWDNWEGEISVLNPSSLIMNALPT